jgi:hypothetical protein
LKKFRKDFEAYVGDPSKGKRASLVVEGHGFASSGGQTTV